MCQWDGPTNHTFNISCDLSMPCHKIYQLKTVPVPVPESPIPVLQPYYAGTHTAGRFFTLTTKSVGNNYRLMTYGM